MAKVLFAGEQFTVLRIDLKAVDWFGAGSYETSGEALVGALKDKGHDVEWMKTSAVPVEFPEKLGQLQAYDAILVSDVGSDSFLFHPEMLNKSIPHPNRLALLKEYVEKGGGLAMVGGWMSFGGIEGKAHYHNTEMEELLPVSISPYDDRAEKPEGVTPKVCDKNHPVMKGLESGWPFFLGYNRVELKKGATELLTFGSDPLVAVQEYGKGRSAVFTSDCAPHWGPEQFLEWEGYSIFWDNLVNWLAGK
jgi:uncharacterized membrane protein